MNITLSKDDPALLALESEYERANLLPLSAWKAWVNSIDIQRFRGEPGYLAQLWMMDEQRYRNTYDYLRETAPETLRAVGYIDDDAFGAVGFALGMAGYITRDLLDSVSEIEFLRVTIGISACAVDIGAGYGRLLHRLSQVSPAGVYFGIDAVPLSTYLCEFYLKYRGCSNTVTFPLHRYADIHTADVAMNIQSFSEMPLAAVDFWLKFCADRNIRHFFLSPHAGDLIHAHFVTNEIGGGHLDYYHLFEHYGYAEIRREYKFPVERSAEFIFNTQYVMFERK